MEPNVRSWIAQEIRAEMARQGKTASDLGKVLGLSKQSAAARVRGESPFKGEELPAVARWLDASVGQFMPPASIQTSEAGAA